MSDNRLRKRAGVATIFFVCGFVTASWLSRLPEIQKYFGMSDTLLGRLLLVMSVGSLAAMPFTGIIAVRFGTKNITTWVTLIVCTLFSVIGFFRNAYALIPFFLFLGVLSGTLDVAMNGQAMMVEKLYGRSIMSSFHAFFSIGTFLGAVLGAAFAKNHIDFQKHFLCATVFCLILTFWAIQYLSNDEKKSAENNTKSAKISLPTKAILPLGLIAFCGMSGESCLLDWSAIYMHKIVGTDESMSALGLAAFTWAMLIGRLLGDFLAERFGKRRLLIANSLCAIAGLAISILFIQQWIVYLGFFIVGLSLSSIVPIVYSTAGNTKGVLPSVGISMATTIGYAGFFVSPPLIGFIADSANLRWSFVFTLLLFVWMLILSYRYRFE